MNRMRNRPELLSQATALLMVDVFIRHSDRDVANPNALIAPEGIVAIDHGDAFSGVLQPGTSGAAVAKNEILMSQIESHVVWRVLKRHRANAPLSDVAAQLAAPSDDEIASLLASWPPALDDDASSSRSNLRERLAEFLLTRRGMVEILRSAILSRLQATK